MKVGGACSLNWVVVLSINKAVKFTIEYRVIDVHLSTFVMLRFMDYRLIF